MAFHSFIAKEYSIASMGHIFLHSCICWWTFRFLPVLAVCNQCCYEHRLHVSFWISFSDVYQGGNLLHQCGNSILVFWGTRHNVFHRGCINLHSHQQWRRFPLAPHPLQHFTSVFHSSRMHLHFSSASPIITESAHTANEHLLIGRSMDTLQNFVLVIFHLIFSIV